MKYFLHKTDQNDSIIYIEYNNTVQNIEHAGRICEKDKHLLAASILFYHARIIFLLFGDNEKSFN